MKRILMFVLMIYLFSFCFYGCIFFKVKNEKTLKEKTMDKILYLSTPEQREILKSLNKRIPEGVSISPFLWYNLV